MSKPVLVVVVDDAQTRQLLERDLEANYGQRYSVYSTARGRDALEALANLKSNKQSVPLIAVDSHVSDMAAIDVCLEAVGVFPDARRVLLIECAQENAAIAAVKARQVDDYVVGPWQPPDQRLYPLLNELLADWEAHFRPPFAGLQVMGSRFSRQSHETRDFLVRNCGRRLISVDPASRSRKLPISDDS